MLLFFRCSIFACSLGMGGTDEEGAGVEESQIEAEEPEEETVDGEAAAAADADVADLQSAEPEEAEAASAAKVGVVALVVGKRIMLVCLCSVLHYYFHNIGMCISFLLVFWCLFFLVFSLIQGCLCLLLMHLPFLLFFFICVLYNRLRKNPLPSVFALLMFSIASIMLGIPRVCFVLHV